MPVIVVAGKVNPVSLAPTLLTPPNGTYLDLSGTPTFTWQYNPGQTGLTQTAYAFLRIVNGGAFAQFWNAGSGTWQSTPVYNSSSSQSLTFPTSTVTTNANMSSTAAASITNLQVLSTTGFGAGGITVVTDVGIATYTVNSVLSGTHLSVTFVSQTGGTGHVTTGLVTRSAGAWQTWQDGNVYQWSVQTQDANGTGAQAGYFTLNAQSAPSVTVTAPSGTISTADPLVTWTNVLAPGAQQTSYRVVIFTQAQYTAGDFALPAEGSAAYSGSACVYDSGQLGGSYTFSLDLSAVPIYLADSISYRTYMQVTETGGQFSSWAYTAFATSYTAPTTPTVTAAAGTDGATGCPLINVTVTGAAYAPGGTQQAIILRTGSDGSSVYVRNASPLNPATLGAGHTVTVPDYEVIPAVAYTYAAQIVVITGPNQSVISGTGTSSPPVVVTTAGWWLLNPLEPSTAVNINPLSWEVQTTEQSTAHLVAGQSVPNIVANAMGGNDGTATFVSFTPAVYLAFQALLQSQATIFVSSPWSVADSLYARFGPQTGGMSSGTGNLAKDSTLQPGTLQNMYRTTAITWVAQFRPSV